MIGQRTNPYPRTGILRSIAVLTVPGLLGLLASLGTAATEGPDPAAIWSFSTATMGTVGTVQLAGTEPWRQSRSRADSRSPRSS